MEWGSNMFKLQIPSLNRLCKRAFQRLLDGIALLVTDSPKANFTPFQNTQIVPTLTFIPLSLNQS